VAGEKDAIDDGKIKKMRGEGYCGVLVDGGWLLDRGIVNGWEKEIKRMSHWGILSDDLEFWDFNFGIFFCSERQWWNVNCEEKTAHVIDDSMNLHLLC
jgi:hypothetical protein